MTDTSFHQLRFDICENVRLHTQQPSMGTLLELDLSPDVEIKDKGNHLKIEGALRLTGAYLTEEEADAEEFLDSPREELAYIIPVEITLPADRAEMDHISAEIESFDYQMLSPFELKIDAILLIDGLTPETQSVEQSEDQSTEQEQYQQIPLFSGTEATMEAKTQAHDQPFEVESEMIESEVETESTAESTSFSQHLQQTSTDEVDTSVLEDAEDQQTEVAPELVEELSETQEQSVVDTVDEVDEQNSEDIAEDEDVSEPLSNEWTKWLVKENDEQFTPVRIVFAQDADSVQQLAERYEIAPGKIRQANDLDDGDLKKGQIVYIPK